MERNQTGEVANEGFNSFPITQFSMTENSPPLKILKKKKYKNGREKGKKVVLGWRKVEDKICIKKTCDGLHNRKRHTWLKRAQQMGVLRLEGVFFIRSNGRAFNWLY